MIKQKFYFFRLYFIFTFIIFTKFVCIDSIEGKNIESDLVQSVVQEIKELYLDNFFKNFSSDLSSILFQLQNISYNSFNTFNLQNKTKEELILQYKQAKALISYFLNFSFLSDHSKQNIIFFGLVALQSLISNESELNKFLNNGDIGNLLFLATAMGIKFSSIDDLINILNVIKYRCNYLENQNIEDSKYQDTVYEILMQLSIEINKRDIFNQIIKITFTESMEFLKEKIEATSITNKKKIDKKKKK